MAVKIALAGNPNCGKTTLFNALTGSNQFVGNWPGVTVEKKEGRLKGHKDVTIMDLPGIYSLSPYTLEEVVARNYLVADRPDTAATAIFQPLPALVQPSGAKIHAIAEPTFARTHSAWAVSRAAPSNPSKSSIPKVPLLHPKFIKNHKTIVDNRIIVPAFLMKDHPRSHMLRSTFPTVGQ